MTEPQLNIKNQELKELGGKLTTTVYVGKDVQIVIRKGKNKVRGNSRHFLEQTTDRMETLEYRMGFIRHLIAGGNLLKQKITRYP